MFWGCLPVCAALGWRHSRLLGPDLLDILRQSYDHLTIMPNLRSTHDGRLIYQTSYGVIYLQSQKIVGDSVCILACNIPEKS